MAKRDAGNACMFCETFPCVCNPPEKKKAAPRKKAAPKASNHQETPTAVDLADGTRVLGPSPMDAMRAAAAQAESAGNDLLNTVAKRQPVETDPDTIVALAALRPIIHPSERAAIEAATTPEAAKVRAAQWKERRAQH